MCQSLLICPVPWRRENGLCLINMAKISSVNKGNVRFLIRFKCLKAALTLEDWDSWFLLSESSVKIAKRTGWLALWLALASGHWERDLLCLISEQMALGFRCIDCRTVLSVILSVWESASVCGAMWNVSLPASTGCSAPFYPSDPQGQVTAWFSYLLRGRCVSGGLQVNCMKSSKQRF